MKTNKHITLLLVKEKGTVRAKDVVERFQYTPGTARSYLSHLGRQVLVERSPDGYTLTQKGQERLHFFETSGCGNLDCSFCESKSGFLTCPTCGWRQAREKVRFRPTWDTPFFHREAGVYCPLCQQQVLSETEASLQAILGAKI